MRIILVAAALLLTLSFVPASSAASGGGESGTDISITRPTEGCGDCVGVSVHDYERPGSNCADCPEHDYAVGVEYGGGDGSVSVTVCRGGFSPICPIPGRTIPFGT